MGTQNRSTLTSAALHVGLDALSTSSSTLVSIDSREDKRAMQNRLQRRAAAVGDRLSESDREEMSSSSVRGLAASTSTSDTARPSRKRLTGSSATNPAGWVKSTRASGGESDAAIVSDDHRCSDQDLDGGLCSCMRATTSASSEEDTLKRPAVLRPYPAGQESEDAYEKRLFHARRRKMLLDNVADSRSSERRSKALKRRVEDRQYGSDPLRASEGEEVTELPQAPLLHLRRSIPDRRASSPIRGRGGVDELQMQERRKNDDDTSHFSASVGQTSTSSAHTAARKSINGVYERLMQEEEKRREDERLRKEAARQRRRDEKVRREADSALFAKLLASRSDVDDRLKVDEDSNMPPYTSPILSVSPPTQQDISFSPSKRDAPSSDSMFQREGGSANLESPKLAAAWTQKAKYLAEQTNTGKSSNTVATQFLSPPSPIPPSPSSSDSVRSFVFPATSSPSVNADAQQAIGSPQLLGLQADDEVPSRRGQGHSRHRRGTGRDGRSTVVSMSARTPPIDKASAAARLAATLGSPIVDLGREVKYDDEVGHRRERETSTERHVKFSPRPEIITSFAEPTAGSDGGTQSEDEDEEDRVGQPILQEAVPEGEKINLDFELGATSSPKRQSPISSRSTSSPRTPEKQSRFPIGSESLKRSDSPPLPAKDLVQVRLNAPEAVIASSQSWGSHMSLSDTSLSVHDLDAIKEEQEDEFVAEASASTLSAPMSSTPPRSRRSISITDADDTGAAGLTVDGLAGDDSVKITLDQLTRVVRRREESKESSVQTELVIAEQEALAQRTTALDALAALTAIVEAEEAEPAQKAEIGGHLDAEYEQRLQNARQRLARIANGFTREKFASPTQRIVPRWVFAVALASFALFQLTFFLASSYAAHVKAEQMYFSVHPGPLALFTASGIAYGPHQSAFPHRTFANLFRPVLMDWGIIPDVGRLITGDDALLAKSWLGLLRWVWSQFLRQGIDFTVLRIVLAKLAHSLGFFETNIVPLGLQLPS